MMTDDCRNDLELEHGSKEDGGMRVGKLVEEQPGRLVVEQDHPGGLTP